MTRKPKPRPRRAPGTGSVFLRKRDGRWVAQLSSGPRGAQTFRTRLAADQDEAEAKLAELIAERDGLAAKAREPLTVGAYLESWVTEARGIRPTTRHGYQVVVKYHLTPAIGHIRLAELDPADVETMLADMDGTMAPKTLLNIHRVLRRALQQAVRTGRASRNVAAREFVDSPKVPVVEPRALTTAEIERLVAVLELEPRDRLEPLITTALGTGLRMGELLGLAWEDVDTKARLLWVRKELVYLGTKGKYDRGEPKTERSKRQVPLTDVVAAALDRQHDQLIAEGFVPVSSSPVFAAPTGLPLNGSWVTHHFYKLLVLAKIEPRVPFKVLRATFATRLFEAGVADPVISKLLGHNRVHTTKSYYLNVRDELARDAVNRLVG